MTKQQREAIVAMILEGKSDHAIWRATGVDRHPIAAVRRELGEAPYSRSVPMDQQIQSYATPPDGEGHVYWSGPGDPERAPRIRFHSSELAVTHVIYAQRAGRPPVGQVRPECSVKRCIAPAHLLDDLERRKVRLALRAVYDMPGHWDVCETCGSTWDDEGRVEGSLSLYCRRCTRDRARRNRSKGTKS